MSLGPAWLPQLHDTDGNWAEVCGRLFEVFSRDFYGAAPAFQGRKVLWDTRREDGKYDECFWHLITKTDPASGDRLVDTARAKRIAWSAAIIRNSADAAVSCWDSKEAGKLRTYLWLKAMDFVVVLEKRKSDRCVLVTAYVVEGDSSRRKLQRSYDRRV